MLDTLARNIIYGTTYCAFEHIGSKDNERIKLLITQYKKGEITILKETEVASIENIGNLKDVPKHGQLILNNEQVLTKEVSQGNESNDTVLLNQAFPSIDSTHFYYEILRISGKAYVFICRKSYINECIELYENQGILITAWRLGFSAMENYEGILTKPTSFISEDYSFAYDQDTLISVSPATENYAPSNYRIQDIQVHSDYLNTLGIILENFGIDTRVTSNAEDAISEKQQHYTQHRIYALGLPIAIGSLLLIFLVNFFVYNHYFTKVEDLEVLGNTNTLQRKLLLKKDSIVDQKQRLFEDVIASSSSSSSYFIDEIIGLMPNTLLLDRLTYHPLLKKMRKGKPLAILPNSIEIQGSTAINNDLSQWINALEKKEFVKEVSIKDLDKKGRFTNFNLTIVLGS